MQSLSSVKPLQNSLTFKCGRLLLVIAALPIVTAFLKAPFEIIQWLSLGGTAAKMGVIDSLISAIWAALAGGSIILALGMLSSRSGWQHWREVWHGYSWELHSYQSEKSIW